MFLPTTHPESPRPRATCCTGHNSALPMALTSGTKLGPYEIQSQLGAGGMGEVYRARDTRLDRIVAIKVLPASFATDTERLRRFEQEARSVAALNHPNILAVYDIGSYDSAPYMVSELLEGETIRERLLGGVLSSKRPLNLPHRLRMDWPRHTIEASSTAI